MFVDKDTGLGPRLKDVRHRRLTFNPFCHYSISFAMFQIVFLTHMGATRIIQFRERQEWITTLI